MNGLEKKNSINNKHSGYLKLQLICKLCSDQVEFQNLSQLRYHEGMHEDSFKKDIYLELLQ